MFHSALYRSKIHYTVPQCTELFDSTLHCSIVSYSTTLHCWTFDLTPPPLATRQRPKEHRVFPSLTILRSLTRLHATHRRITPRYTHYPHKPTQWCSPEESSVTHTHTHIRGNYHHPNSWVSANHRDGAGVWRTVWVSCF